MSNPSLSKLFVGLFFALSFIFQNVHAQFTSPTQLGLTPPGAVRGQAVPPDSLPTLDKRAEALMKAGVPSDVINNQVLPNTGTPQNPISQPLPSQMGQGVQPEIPGFEGQAATGKDVGLNAPGVFRQGDNVKMMTLFNTTTGKIDTFRSYDEWVTYYLQEEKIRKQRAYDAALRNPNTLFGHHIFLKDDFTRSDTTTYAPPESYMVQVGDKFLVQVTGKAELFEYLEVDKDGTVFRQFMGKKVVAGTSYAQARKTIENGYRKMVPDGTTIIISLTKNRSTISVNVTGEVVEPGTYTLPNVTNAISAIFAAKGIRDLGSVRTIYIKREGKTVKTIDLYDYLVNGNTEMVYLKNNDFIFVPIQKNIVSVEGGVKRPMRYELKEGETVKDLIHFAGGLTFNASKNNVQIARTDNGKDGVIDLNLEVEGSKKMLDGDILRVRTAYSRRDAIAQISGPVKYPGTYDWQKGKRVKDLIDKAGGLTPEAYLDRAYVVRIPEPGKLAYIPIDLKDLKDSTNNIRIEYLDELLIYNNLSFKPKNKHIVVNGEVKKPGFVVSDPNMTLKQLLFMVEGLGEEAEADNIELYTLVGSQEEIERRILRNIFLRDSAIARLRNNTEENRAQIENQSLTSAVNTLFSSNLQLRRVSIPKDWKNDPQLDTILVNKYVMLNVMNKQDFILSYKTQIEGAVVNPVEVANSPGLTLKDLIFAAGGIDREAVVDYVDLYVRQTVREKGNMNLKTDNKEIVRIKINENWRNNPLYDSIKVAPYYKVYVHDQRKFYMQGTVQVKGEVTTPGELPYRPQMTLKDAIYLAGGINIQANYSKIEVSRVLDVEKAKKEISPTKIKVFDISTSQDWQNDPRLDSILLFPYDQVFIRPNPDFKLQDAVFVSGRVRIPGEYHILEDKERLTDLVKRAGGLQPDAFLEGAYIERPEYGKITIDFDKAWNKPGSKYDLLLKKQDKLIIPELSEIVIVRGNIFRDTLGITKGLLNEKERNFMYDPSYKSSLYYINLAGGIQENTPKRKIMVIYPNGRIKKTRNYLFFKSYPNVTKGSIVYLPERKKKSRDPEELQQRAALGERINQAVAGASSVLTFLVLIRSLLK